MKRVCPTHGAYPQGTKCPGCYPYSCLNCGASFRGAEAMNEHIDSEHPDDYGYPSVEDHDDEMRLIERRALGRE